MGEKTKAGVKKGSARRATPSKSPLPTGAESEAKLAGLKSVVAPHTLRLLLMDHGIVSWMAENNSVQHSSTVWAADLNHNLLWYGVMVQIGRYRKITDDGDLDVFGSVRFIETGSSTAAHTIRRVDLPDIDNKNGDKIWINIVNKEVPSRPDPIDKDHIETLGLYEPPLHQHFTAFNIGLTLWQSKFEGFEMKSACIYHPHVPSYIFSIPTKWCTVQVWRKPAGGAWAVERAWNGIQLDWIVVGYDDEGDHGSHLGPPQK